MKKLHPLHTPEFVDRMVRHSGCYPGPERCTGRTTVLALDYLSLALKQPHVPVHVKDHEPYHYNHVEVLNRMQDMAEALGLEHLKFNKAHLTVTFTR